MLLKIVELCVTDTDEIGEREYIYNSEETNYDDAVIDYYNNFNPDNVLNCNDEFYGECTESYTTEIKELDGEIEEYEEDSEDEAEDN